MSRLDDLKIKIFADGAMGSRGGLLFEPYADDPGNSGLRLIDPATLEAAATEALRNGWQVATHAIGDRANDMVLEAYARARRAVPEATDPRLRIEHAQVVRRADVARFAELGVIASMQPSHASDDMRWADARGDSFRLSVIAKEHPEAEFIVFCGVHFMAESADVLTGPDQKVILPDLNAGCSMADMADLDSVEEAWDDLATVTREQGRALEIRTVLADANVDGDAGGLLEGLDELLVRRRRVRGRVVVRAHHAERHVAHVVELVVVGHVAGGDELDAGLVHAALAELLHHRRARARGHEDEHRVGLQVAHLLQERREVGVRERHADR